MLHLMAPEIVQKNNNKIIQANSTDDKGDQETNSVNKKYDSIESFNTTHLRRSNFWRLRYLSFDELLCYIIS